MCVTVLAMLLNFSILNQQNFCFVFHAPCLFSQDHYNKKAIKEFTVLLKNDLAVSTILWAKNDNHLV